jgi:hypothetical protein
MRLLLAIPILAFSATCAQAAEDRYGPPRAAPVAAGAPAVSALPGSAAPYSGALLSWSGKSAAPAATPTAAPVPATPQPIAAWARAAGPGQSRSVAYPSMTAPASYGPTQPPAPTPAPRAAAPLPTSLYDRATPAPAAPQAQAALPPSPSARGPAPLPTADDASRARAYSVVREFGGVPDPISIPPPTSYWATRPGMAPVDEVPAASGGGVGGETRTSEGETSEDRRRERER